MHVEIRLGGHDHAPFSAKNTGDLGINMRHHLSQDGFDRITRLGPPRRRRPDLQESQEEIAAKPGGLDRHHPTGQRGEVIGLRPAPRDVIQVDGGDERAGRSAEHDGGLRRLHPARYQLEAYEDVPDLVNAGASISSTSSAPDPAAEPGGLGRLQPARESRDHLRVIPSLILAARLLDRIGEPCPTRLRSRAASAGSIRPASITRDSASLSLRGTFQLSALANQRAARPHTREASAGSNRPAKLDRALAITPPGDTQLASKGAELLRVLDQDGEDSGDFADSFPIKLGRSDYETIGEDIGVTGMRRILGDEDGFGNLGRHRSIDSFGFLRAHVLGGGAEFTGQPPAELDILLLLQGGDEDSGK